MIARERRYVHCIQWAGNNESEIIEFMKELGYDVIINRNFNDNYIQVEYQPKQSKNWDFSFAEILNEGDYLIEDYESETDFCTLNKELFNIYYEVIK